MPQLAVGNDVSASVDDRRPAELVASLAAVRTALADAATAAGRDPWSVTLIAVTKTFPATDIAILLGLGVADIGESRDQEARGEAGPAAARATPRAAPTARRRRGRRAAAALHRPAADEQVPLGGALRRHASTPSTARGRDRARRRGRGGRARPAAGVRAGQPGR